MAVFLIKLPNEVTYLLETQLLGLFTLGESINVAIFALPHTHVRVLNLSQHRSVEFGITQRYCLHRLPRMTQTAGSPIPEERGGVLQSYARLIAFAMQNYRSCHDNTVGMFIKY